MKNIFKVSRYFLCLLFMVTTLFAKVTKIDVISFNDFHGNVAEDTREKGKNIVKSICFCQSENVIKDNE